MNWMEEIPLLFFFHFISLNHKLQKFVNAWHINSSFPFFPPKVVEEIKGLIRLIERPKTTVKKSPLLTLTLVVPLDMPLKWVSETLQTSGHIKKGIFIVSSHLKVATIFYIWAYISLKINTYFEIWASLNNLNV